MTATEWSEGEEPKGWYMTEKYDGMRLYWNGTQFYTRQGRKITVPESVTKRLPVVALDGELWYFILLSLYILNIFKGHNMDYIKKQ